MQGLGIVRGIHDDLYHKTYEHALHHHGVAPGWSNTIDKVRGNLTDLSKLTSEIVFILPDKHASKKCAELGFEKFIYFDQVAEIVEDESEIGNLFAKYLRRWSDCRAGSRNPSRRNE